jgi:hypothetical protein
MTKSWDVAPAATLGAVLTWCQERRRVDRLLVATRLDRESKKPMLLYPGVAESVRRIFGKQVLHETMARRWAGTELIGHSGKVYLIAFNEDVKQRMIEAENRWGAWTGNHTPPLPEDLCLFRDGDAVPLFVSVTHDEEAWIFDDEPVPRNLATPSKIRLPEDLLPPPPFYR